MVGLSLNLRQIWSSRIIWANSAYDRRDMSSRMALIREPWPITIGNDPAGEVGLHLRRIGAGSGILNNEVYAK